MEEIKRCKRGIASNIILSIINLFTAYSYVSKDKGILFIIGVLLSIYFIYMAIDSVERLIDLKIKERDYE